MCATLLLLPFLFLFGAWSSGDQDGWQHLQSTVLSEYTLNTLVVLTGVGLLSLFLGGGFALLTSLYDFPGRRFFSIALLLPLALPSYIAAYAFSGFFAYTGPLDLLGRSLGQTEWHYDLMHRGGLIVVLALVLYPYVFATARVALQSRYNSYLESARSLGLSQTKMLVKVVIPLLRPALAGGVFLASMEVLNDYGAMKYFGVPTYTMGIFRAWFAMGDLGSAVRLALMLFALVAVLALLEGWYNRKTKVTESHRSRPLQRIALTGRGRMAATVLSSALFGVAFVLPVIYLLWLLVGADLGRAVGEWTGLAWNSLKTALIATVVILAVVVFTQFVRLLAKTPLAYAVGKSISIGYSLPGAIIAVGVLLLSASLDGGRFGLVLTGGFTMLVFAYTIRFSGVAYQPLHAESEKRSSRMFEAGQSLRMKPIAVLRRLYLPLSIPGIRLAAIMVVIDMLKELPLTLILRPFNFSTLATKAFEYADDEMLARAALPALSVIAVGLIPVLLLNRILRSS